MKRNDITKLHSLTVNELQKQLEKLTAELIKTQLERRAGKLKNVRLVGTLRDDIARVKTVLARTAEPEAAQKA